MFQSHTKVSMKSWITKSLKPHHYSFLNLSVGHDSPTVQLFFQGSKQLLESPSPRSSSTSVLPLSNSINQTISLYIYIYIYIYHSTSWRKTNADEVHFRHTARHASIRFLGFRNEFFSILTLMVWCNL